MNYLLYCVFRGGRPPEAELPTGIQGKPVLVVDRNGLGAAVSEIAQIDPVPDVATVLTYEGVVEYLFGRRTIIPMRYGCTVPDRMGLAALLDGRHKDCEALLHSLDGLAEMGIQFTASTCEADPAIDSPEVQLASSQPSDRSGVSYLLAKQQHYDSADRVAEARNQLVTTVCRALSGQFVRHKVERPASRHRVVSIYFLVPRGSVESFREASRRCLEDRLTKLVVSGPWPPYNFADIANISGN
jgi:hypothetical protein